MTIPRPLTPSQHAAAHRIGQHLRLVDVTKVDWHERAQFFAMAAQMMRRILVDAARARGSHKRGGMAPKVNIGSTGKFCTTL